MKIALIGAGGVRTPLLIHGLAEAGERLPMDEIAFWDPDAERVTAMRRVAEAMGQRSGLRAKIRAFSIPEQALEGADFIITSIRVGGIEARIKDEEIALAHGLVGQETVGAGGFACASRNMPAMLRYARMIEQIAPHATVINFTNPVGIVSQGLLNHSRIRILGVCDTPLETFEAIAKALGQNPFALQFDYLGLNHLGWVRAVRDENGNDLLPRILSSPELIERCYRHGLFPADFIQKLGLLPTEYLYFYYFPGTAYANTKRSGQSRGRAVSGMNAQLFLKLSRAPDRELVEIYENYLGERNASYFSIEATAGKGRRENRELYSQFSGYERIALLVLRALHSETASTIPLTIRNDSALEDLAPDDAVELPCRISSGGVQALKVGRAPETVRPLLIQVKEYERLTVRAVMEGSVEVAVAALTKNPLVGKPDVAREILAEYMRKFGAQMTLQPA